MSYAQLGFPSIQEVDLQQKDAVEEENSGVQVAGQGSGKKKSLFAKQLGEMPLSMFAMVDRREQVSVIHWFALWVWLHCTVGVAPLHCGCGSIALWVWLHCTVDVAPF